MKHAAVFAIGNELLGGYVLNGNAKYLSELLESHGYSVTRHLVVGDDITVIANAFRELAQDHHLVMVTGGLGPTSDDKTREGVAWALGVELQQDFASLDRLEALMASRNRAVKEAHKLMTFFPQGATIVPNDVGAADGFYFTINECCFLCMPGVPVEMQAIADRFFREHLPEDSSYIATTILSYYGIPESDIMDKIPHLMEGTRHTIGLLPNDGIVRIRIVSRSDFSQGDAAEIGQTVVGEILPLFPSENLFSSSNLDLNEAIVQRLIRSGKQVALAESCSGGKLADAIISVPGASAIFPYGAVFYSNEAKQRLLGVPQHTLETYGAVSAETAAAMAESIQRLANADYGVSTTGIAGPSGGSAEKPVGTVYIGIATPSGVRVKHVLLRGNRELIRRRATQAALFELYDALEK